MGLLNTFVTLLSDTKTTKMLRVIKMWNETYSKVPVLTREKQKAYDEEEQMFNDIMQNKNVSMYLKNKELNKKALTIMRYKKQKVK